MKRNYVTIILIVLVVVLCAFRFERRIHPAARRGIRIVLVHNCTNEEALRQLGDDRQIVVTNHADGSIWIDETPFTASAVGPELSKIFDYRSLKLVWFI